MNLGSVMNGGSDRWISAGVGVALTCSLWGMCASTVGCAGRAACDQAAEAPAASGTPPPNAASTMGELLDPNAATATLRVTLPTATSGVLPAESSAGALGCTGKNVSLGVEWQGAPAGTKSFAVIMHDPDAPTGVGFCHWTVFDIPASASGLSAGSSPKSLPAGRVTRTMAPTTRLHMRSSPSSRGGTCDEVAQDRRGVAASRRKGQAQ